MHCETFVRVGSLHDSDEIAHAKKHSNVTEYFIKQKASAMYVIASKIWNSRPLQPMQNELQKLC